MGPTTYSRTGQEVLENALTTLPLDTICKHARVGSPSGRRYSTARPRRAAQPTGAAKHLAGDTHRIGLGCVARQGRGDTQCAEKKTRPAVSTSASRNARRAAQGFALRVHKYVRSSVQVGGRSFSGPSRVRTIYGTGRRAFMPLGLAALAALIAGRREQVHKACIVQEPRECGTVTSISPQQQALLQTPIDKLRAHLKY